MPCSRREFLQMVGAFALTATGGSLVPGCSPQKGTPETIPKPEVENYPSGKILFLSDFKEEIKTVYTLNPSLMGLPKGIGKLWLANSNGSESILIADNVATLPLWSPSGDRFVAIRTGLLSMYDQNGHHLVSGIGSFYDTPDLAWSPDGNFLIVKTSLGFDEYDLRVKQREQADFWDDYWPEERQLVASYGGVLDHDFSLSPDGKKFVFVHHEFGRDYYITLADYDREKMPYKGEDRNNGHFNPDFTTLVNGESITHNERFKFQWTPDGRKIVCLGNDGLFVIDTVNLSSQGIDLKFCHPQSRGFAIDWFAEDNVDLSTDGRQIVIGCEGSLLITDPEFKKKREVALTDNPTIIPRHVRWLENNQVIAFEQAGQFFYINADGSNLRKISLGTDPKNPFGFFISSASR